MNPLNVRLSLAETLWLEPEYFEQAKETSNQETSNQEASNRMQSESQQWKAYLNSLGLSAFVAWVKEKLPTAEIQTEASKTTAGSYLEIEAFKVCLITTEHVLDEVVRFSKSVVDQPKLAAHLYVVLEILEDQQQAVVRGFLRHDELTEQLEKVAQPSEQYRLPLSYWDEEINHLLGYVQYAQPSAIPLPQAAAAAPAALAAPAGSIASAKISITRLGQWLDETLTEGWQSIDQLINPAANLAWSARKGAAATKRGKLINLGMQLDQQTVALVVTVIPEGEKIGINVQILPTGEETVLPPQLTVALRSSTDRVLQAVTSRAQDNYIQLRSFRGKSGVRFTVDVSLGDVSVSEAFEL